MVQRWGYFRQGWDVGAMQPHPIPVFDDSALRRLIKEFKEAQAAVQKHKPDRPQLEQLFVPPHKKNPHARAWVFWGMTGDEKTTAYVDFLRWMLSPEGKRKSKKHPFFAKDDKGYYTIKSYRAYDPTLGKMVLLHKRVDIKDPPSSKGPHKLEGIRLTRATLSWLWAYNRGEYWKMWAKVQDQQNAYENEALEGYRHDMRVWEKQRREVYTYYRREIRQLRLALYGD